MELLLIGVERTWLTWSESRTTGSGDEERTETVYHPEHQQQQILRENFIIANLVDLGSPIGL